ncbi:PEGA domain-containing protein [Methanoculleus bourgensis]|uniref:PEGA domain-containing protein n=1 Tax=Methanoculleus bourgensis TaxID=83986 RepID=UPI001BD99371|nr:PEGA domain-containing protein [Methanoculleus bourgensis]MBT0733641.1 PEGA domain-containing protein [Methanoculleus bourgensis]
MRYRVPLICLLILALFSAGCTSPENLPGTSSQGKATSTPTPTPGYGSIAITSNPMGAEIYLDGELKGTAPLTLTNIPAGKHTLLVTKIGYVESNSTVTVTADKETKVSKSLKQGKPKLSLDITGSNMVYQGMDPLMEISGTVRNTGEESAFETRLVITMTPKDSKEKNLKVTKIHVIGPLNPGDEKRYVEHLQLKRGIEYRGTIKCEYRDGSKMVSGASKSF